MVLQTIIPASLNNSLDYLLKPIDETELRAALQKVQTMKTSATNTDAITQLLDVLASGQIEESFWCAVLELLLLRSTNEIY